MSASPLPTAKEIRDIFEGMLGRSVELENDYEFIKPDEEFGAAVATYVDDLGNFHAAAVMDLDLCAYTGAAFQLVPAAAAQDAINEACLPDSWIENVYELLNIFSSLFNKEGYPHLKIDLMYTPGEQLPKDLYKTVTSFVERRDSILHVEGYGKGRFGVITP